MKFSDVNLILHMKCTKMKLLMFSKNILNKKVYNISDKVMPKRNIVILGIIDHIAILEDKE